MKHAALVLLLLAIAGCSRFDNPIVSADGPALDPALVGRWAAERDAEQVSFQIEAAGDRGIVVMSGIKDGKRQEERLNVITSRVGKLTFLSAQSIRASDGDEPSGSWYYFRYELPTPDRLVLYADDGERWRSAVLDGLVEGTVDSKARNFTVTASSEELREFLEGYGSVIFKDEASGELHRVASD